MRHPEITAKDEEVEEAVGSASRRCKLRHFDCYQERMEVLEQSKSSIASPKFPLPEICTLIWHSYSNNPLNISKYLCLTATRETAPITGNLILEVLLAFTQLLFPPTDTLPGKRSDAGSRATPGQICGMASLKIALCSELLGSQGEEDQEPPVEWEGALYCWETYEMERFRFCPSISRDKESHANDFLHGAFPHHPSSNFQNILCALHLEHTTVHKFSLATVNGVDVPVTVVSALTAGVYVENIIRALSGRSPV